MNHRPPAETPPRHTTRRLPPYRYLPGGDEPHPVRDPRGWLHGRPEPVEEALRPDRWAEQPGYLWGLDLFNRGYDWEAHEAWEGVWMRSSDATQRSFLQALIQVAAARLQARRGRLRGVTGLLDKALERLNLVRAGTEEETYMGLPLEPLRAGLRRLRNEEPDAVTELNLRAVEG